MIKMEGRNANYLESARRLGNFIFLLTSTTDE